MPSARHAHPDLPPSGVLDAWAASRRALSVESLANAGGFSGARFWRIDTPVGMCCLRRWPCEHPDPNRLAWIHAVLQHAARHGFDRLPLPLTTDQGATFIEQAGYLWQLEPWLSGKAYTRRGHHMVADRECTAAAMRALAEFHQAVASFPTDHSQGTSASAAWRARRLEWLFAGGLERLRAALDSSPSPRFRYRAQELLERFPVSAAGLRSKLAEATGLVVPLQPCIRDIWCEHVLLEGNRVVGLIDFGAMRVDNVACDVARLLGSLAQGESACWRLGLAAYQEVRPLSADEQRLLVAMERSTAAMGGLQWIEWCCIERRQFPDMQRIIDRLDEFLLRMRENETDKGNGLLETKLA